MTDSYTFNTFIHTYAKQEKKLRLKRAFIFKHSLQQLNQNNYKSNARDLLIKSG